MTGAEFWAAVEIFALGAAAGWFYRGWYEWNGKFW